MAPTRSAVRRWLTELASGVLCREEAAEFARPWIGEREAEVTDAALWVPLGRLASADLESAPTEHLYGTWDFETWLTEFELSVEFEDARCNEDG